MIGTARSSDEALVLAYAREGDRGALERLVERHFAAAYRLAVKVLGDPGAAEDAAEEAFVNLIRGARRFQEGRAFAPWFTTFVLNAVRNASRSRARRERHERAAATRRPSPAGSGLSALDSACVEEHVQRLPLDVRVPIVLHYYEGHSHEAIAELTGCPKGTAASRIRRGLEQLRESLAGAGFGAIMVGSLTELLERPGDVGPLPARPSAAALEALAAKTTTAALLAKAGLVVALFALSIAGASYVLQDPERPASAPRSAPLVALAPASGPVLSPPQPAPAPPPASPPLAVAPPPPSAPVLEAPPPAAAPRAGALEVREKHFLAWRVKARRGFEVVLVGSIPYPSESALSPPKALESAFEEASELVVVADPTAAPEKTQNLMLALGTFTPPDAIDRHVSSGTYRRLEEHWSKVGAPRETASLMKPWLVAAAIEHSRAMGLGFDQESVLARFLRKAHEEKKPVRELSSLERELRRLDDLERSEQEKLLERVLVKDSVLKERFEALVRAWNEGDADLVTNHEPPIGERAYEKVCEEVARGVRKAIAKGEGRPVVVIEASLLGGAKGVLQRLANEKLEVEPFSAK